VRAIRRRRIAPAQAGQGPAVNLPGARCFSACVYALMGAKKRVVPPSSLVGIHRMFFYEDAVGAAAGEAGGKRTFGSTEFVARLADYAKAMGVSRDLIYTAENNAGSFSGNPNWLHFEMAKQSAEAFEAAWDKIPKP
jgi:hypothetical protein